MADFNFGSFGGSTLFDPDKFKAISYAYENLMFLIDEYYFAGEDSELYQREDEATTDKHKPYYDLMLPIFKSYQNFIKQHDYAFKSAADDDSPDNYYSSFGRKNSESSYRTEKGKAI